MGTTLMSLLVKLGVNSSELTTGLENAESQSQTTANNIGSSLSSIGKNMQKTGAIMTASMTLPIVAAGGVALSAASDLEESMNAVNVVFQEAAGIILDYGETSAETVGLANSEFNQLATVTGAFLRNVGFDAAGAADQTIILAERAADMASVFNTDVSQALGAIQSGLKGEFNPLETFGVKINAAAIEAKALAMGLADANGDLSDSAKAQAALALIMEQTAVTAGDFTNTSDGMANSMRIQKAMLTDLAAEFGEQLMPLMIEFLQIVNPLLKSFSDLDPEVKKTIVVVLGLVAALGPVITTIGTVVSAIGSLITFFGAGGAAATAFSTVGTFLSGTVLPAIGAAITAIGLPVIALVAAVGLLIVVIKKFGADAWNTVQMILVIIGVKLVQAFDWFKQKLVDVRDYLSSKFLAAVNAIKKPIDDVKEWFATTTQSIKDGIQTAKDKIQEFRDYLVNKVQTAFGGISDAISTTIGWAQTLANKLSGLSIPSWLTPGSPTPFETGLRGISDAMKQVSRTGIPELQETVSVKGQPSLGQPMQPKQSTSAGIDYDRLARSMVNALQTSGVL